MRFLVIGIDRNTGAAVLLTETPLPTRESAIDALSTLASTEQPDLASYHVTLVDLDAGVPVLLIAAPREPVPAPALEPGFEEPAWVAEPAAEPEAAERRAEPADDMHAPDLTVVETEAAVVGTEAAVEPAAFAPDAFAALEEPLYEPPLPGPGEPEPLAPSAEMAADMLDASVEVPVEEPLTSVVAEADRPSLSEPFDGEGLLDALRRAADSLVLQGIEVPQTAEEASAPILPGPEETAAQAEISVAEPMGVIESAQPAPAPVAEDVVPETEPVRPVIMGEYPEALDTTAAAPSEVQQYQPSGELEITAYTCNDCVYSNTCPKAGESSPADCGTFQWRSF